MREECLRSGAVVDCVDTASDPHGIVDAEACGRMGIGAVVAAPVCVGGRTVGVLEMHSALAYNFMGDDVEVLKRVADVIGAVNFALAHEVQAVEDSRILLVLSPWRNGAAPPSPTRAS